MMLTTQWMLGVCRLWTAWWSSKRLMALAMPEMDSVMVKHRTASMYEFCSGSDICRHSSLCGGFLHSEAGRGLGAADTTAGQIAKQHATSMNRLVLFILARREHTSTGPRSSTRDRYRRYERSAGRGLATPHPL